MLETAQLYKCEIEAAFQKNWYNQEYMYYFMDGYRYIPNIGQPNNCFTHDFASTHNNSVVGYISYRLDKTGKIADTLSIMCFDKTKSDIFFIDLITALRNMFEIYNIEHLFFNAVDANPALPKYRRIVQHIGGKELCIMHNRCILENGEYGNKVCFEVSRKNYIDRQKRILTRSQTM